MSIYRINKIKTKEISDETNTDKDVIQYILNNLNEDGYYYTGRKEEFKHFMDDNNEIENKVFEYLTKNNLWETDLKIDYW